MNIAHKVVTHLPVTELWRNDGYTITSRIRSLAATDITDLLRNGRVQFVVADVGTSLHWVPLAECYDFWKREVQPRLAAPESLVPLDDFTDGYCYFASQWSSSEETVSTVACEKHH